MKPEWWMLFLTILLSIGLLGMQWLPLDNREGLGEKLSASEKSLEGMEVLREAALKRGIEPALEEDPWGTTLIGIEYSELTTTLGNLAVKQLSLNPNFAAMVVDQLMEAGIGSGDLVAIHFSGSFPALNLSVLAACDAMGVQTVILSSMGASNWGANRTEWTWMDMEQTLMQQGWLKRGSKAITMGGSSDLGIEMPAELHRQLAERAEGYGIPLIVTESLEEQIRHKWQSYHQEGVPDVLINVGGNATIYGSGEYTEALSSGIQPRGFTKPWAEGESLMQLFDEAGIPVIHLLNLRSLAFQYDLGEPGDKQPLPGEGGVFRTPRWIRVYGIFWLFIGMTGVYRIREMGGAENAGNSN